MISTAKMPIDARRTMASNIFAPSYPNSAVFGLAKGEPSTPVTAIPLESYLTLAATVPRAVPHLPRIVGHFGSDEI
jgi:hypothetical protein